MPAEIDQALRLTNEALKGRKLEKHEIITVIQTMVEYLGRMG